MTQYLTSVTVVAIHDDQIARYGGAAGIRDPGLIEAAIFRPQTGYYADLIEEVAALWESLSQNHAFVDGNKRVALAATIAFLGINGVDVVADPDALYEFMMGLYQSNAFTFDRLAVWLRANTRPF